MVFFITVLRFLAALLITNSHFGGIYPHSSLACGGMLGNLLFFAVSGYCLYNVRGTFLRWYGQRLLRIYPAVVIVTSFGIFVGYQWVNATFESFISVFLFPTFYHFVAAIVILYIPFYFLMKVPDFRLWRLDKLGWILLAVFTLHLMVYIFFYDKTTYRIEQVGTGQKFPWFIFFESMLLGAIFRKYDSIFRSRRFRPVWDVLMLFLFAIGYAGVRTLLKTGRIPGEYQIVSPIFLNLLTGALFWSASSLDRAMEIWKGSNRWIGRTIEIISSLTLEIYLVQNVVIVFIPSMLKVSFPLNWLACVAVILLGAFLVRNFCIRVTAPLIRILKRG